MYYILSTRVANEREFPKNQYNYIFLIFSLHVKPIQKQCGNFSTNLPFGIAFSQCDNL